MAKKTPPVVLFNASVILAGLKSPAGGSAKLLKMSKQKKIYGIISEVILDEVNRNLIKINLSSEYLSKIANLFQKIYPAPQVTNIKKYYDVVVDASDTHLLASYLETKADYLVSLDKKHILFLQNKLKNITIVSPKQLIEFLVKT